MHIIMFYRRSNQLILCQFIERRLLQNIVEMQWWSKEMQPGGHPSAVVFQTIFWSAWRILLPNADDVFGVFFLVNALSNAYGKNCTLEISLFRNFTLSIENVRETFNNFRLKSIGIVYFMLVVSKKQWDLLKKLKSLFGI